MIDMNERIWWVRKTLQAVETAIEESRHGDGVECGTACDIRQFSQHLAGDQEGDDMAEFIWTCGEYPPYLKDLVTARAMLNKYLRLNAPK